MLPESVSSKPGLTSAAGSVGVSAAGCVGASVGSVGWGLRTRPAACADNGSVIAASKKSSGNTIFFMSSPHGDCLYFYYTMQLLLLSRKTSFSNDRKILSFFNKNYLTNDI
jgi:hypothetical protein